MKKILMISCTLALTLALLLLSGCSTTNDTATYPSSISGNFQDYVGKSISIEYLVNQSNIQAINLFTNQNLTSGSYQVKTYLQTLGIPYFLTNQYTINSPSNISNENVSVYSGGSTITPGGSIQNNLKINTGIIIEITPSANAQGTFNFALTGGNYIPIVK